MASTATAVIETESGTVSPRAISSAVHDSAYFRRRLKETSGLEQEAVIAEMLDASEANEAEKKALQERVDRLEQEAARYAADNTSLRTQQEQSTKQLEQVKAALTESLAMGTALTTQYLAAREILAGLNGVCFTSGKERRNKSSDPESQAAAEEANAAELALQKMFEEAVPEKYRTVTISDDIKEILFFNTEDSTKKVDPAFFTLTPRERAAFLGCKKPGKSKKGNGSAKGSTGSKTKDQKTGKDSNSASKKSGKNGKSEKDKDAGSISTKTDRETPLNRLAGADITTEEGREKFEAERSKAGRDYVTKASVDRERALGGIPNNFYVYPKDENGVPYGPDNLPVTDDGTVLRYVSTHVEYVEPVPVTTIVTRTVCSMLFINDNGEEVVMTAEVPIETGLDKEEEQTVQEQVDQIAMEKLDELSALEKRWLQYENSLESYIPRKPPDAGFRRSRQKGSKKSRKEEFKRITTEMHKLAKGSYLSPHLLAWIVYLKYALGLPVTRIKGLLYRAGLQPNVATIYYWFNLAARYLAYLNSPMMAELFGQGALHADESPGEVMREPGRSNTTKSYFWFYMSLETASRKVCIVRYHAGRSGDFAKEDLEGFAGLLLTDAYAGYEGIGNVIRCLCMVHARRYFEKASRYSATSYQRRKAGEAVSIFDEIFKLEREYKDLTPEERLARRKAEVQPVVDRLTALVDGLDADPLVLDPGMLRRAVTYFKNNQTGLLQFMNHGEIPSQNMAVEHLIRRYAIVRASCLFYGSPKGARNGADIMSVVFSAMLNGLDVYTYLTFVFSAFRGKAKPSTELLNAILPWQEAPQKYCRAAVRLSREEWIAQNPEKAAECAKRSEELKAQKARREAAKVWREEAGMGKPGVSA